MKNLFGKELREQAKVAVLAIIVLTLGLMQVYKSCTSQLAATAAGQGWLDGDVMQPLMSDQLHSELGVFCAAFGLMLGGLQIAAERNRDLWAFLVHRPMTRGRILRAKISAGLFLYLLGAGAPLLGFIVYMRIPGHAAAPFEWAMTLPLLAIFLLGLVYYLAGMLVALRKARWFGSRAFGVGLAIAATAGVYNASEFWQALLALLLAGSVLAVAVRGNFQTGGYYNGQSRWEKAALIVACLAAAIVLVYVAVFGLFLGLMQSDTVHYTEYAMTRDGAIYKVTHSGVDTPMFVDLEGKPLIDKKTGRPITQKEFSVRCATEYGVNANFHPNQWKKPFADSDYMSSPRFYNPWQVIDKTFWYFTRDGRVVGYNGIDRKAVAALRADPEEKEGFIPMTFYGNNFNGYQPEEHEILASAKSIFAVNLENASLKPIFTVTNGGVIGGYAEAHQPGTRVVVVTRDLVRLLDAGGKTEWTVPYQPSYPEYPGVSVAFLDAMNQFEFAVKFEPDYLTNQATGWKMPSHLVWLARRQGIRKTADLPQLPRFEPNDFWEKVASELMPPAYPMYINDRGNRIWDLIRIIPGLLCAAVGWRLGRRYNFSSQAQAGWGLFNLLFGLPGLLAFLSVQEWPAREKCPQCQQLRVVDREQCPHCGAGFASPAPIGTEIFEPLAAD